MPLPAISDVHVNKPLTNIAVAYMQSQDKFIADKVFPIVPVEKEGDRYFKFDKGDWFRDEARVRAPGTESPGINFRIDNTPTYFCDVHAVHYDIPDVVRLNADSPLSLDTSTTQAIITHQLLIRRERLWASRCFKTGVWGEDWIGGTDFVKWSDITDEESDPIADISRAVIAIEQSTGFSPNVLVLGPEAFAAIKNHPKIIERVKYTQKAVITADILAGLFELERVLVAKAVVNTGEEGKTEDMKYIFGDSALLCYAAPAPAIMAPSAGYTFVWTGLVGSVNGLRIKTFRMEHLASDRIEGELAVDVQVVGKDLGIFFSDTV